MKWEHITILGSSLLVICLSTGVIVLCLRYIDTCKSLDELKKQVAKLDESNEVLKSIVGQQNKENKDGASASTYVRWGRGDCPKNDTELVYDGYIGGSYHDHSGDASNYVCLTKEPLWGHIQNGSQNHGLMFGAEYHFTGHTDNGKEFFGKDLLHFEAPCAVCRTSRSTVIMIPGRNQCVDGWNMEYYGYLATNYRDYKKPTEYVCIDNFPTTVSNISDGSNYGARFFLVDARCGSLKCPPYIEGAEVTCVVCTK